LADTHGRFQRCFESKRERGKVRRFQGEGLAKKKRKPMTVLAATFRKTGRMRVHGHTGKGGKMGVKVGETL